MLTALGPLVASFIAMDVAAMKRKIRRNAILYGIAAAFLWTAYGLLVAALAIHLGERWGLPIAMLVIAGGMIVMALFIIAIVMMLNAAEERRKRREAAANSQRALAMTAAVSALPLLMKSKPLMLLAVAGGLGFLATKGGGSRQGPPAAE
ncbi:hypothetical protein D3C80_584170 [compost metagenome]